MAQLHCLTNCFHQELEDWFFLSFFLLSLLCICKSTMQPSIDYCFHVWEGAPSYYLEMFDKQQNGVM